MRKFPSIGQFRHVVETVNHHATYTGQSNPDGTPIHDPSRPKPTLMFTGRVKLHGSNCGLSFDLNTGEVQAQSRERVLSSEDDNFGFCAMAESHPDAVDLLGCAALQVAIESGLAIDTLARLTVYGEWCGPKVNSKTAIGQLSERLVVFDVLAQFNDESETWLSVEALSSTWRQMAAEGERKGFPVYFVSDYFGLYEAIDFNHPEQALDALERYTLDVEALCPVAKAMGKEGLGEGLVWSLRHPKMGMLRFKTKGTKHKGTRNKRLVDVAPEVLAGRQAFVDAVLTESRLEQGFEQLRATHGKVTLDQLGDFLKWVGCDVLKEESDTLKASGLERKDVMPQINHAAKAWVFPRLAKV